MQKIFCQFDNLIGCDGRCSHPMKWRRGNSLYEYAGGQGYVRNKMDQVTLAYEDEMYPLELEVPV